MPYSILTGLLGLLLMLCSSCTKLSDLQQAYLNYEICTSIDTRFQSLDYIADGLRVEVVKPLERASTGDYFLAGEVHYYDEYNQLLAIITYGVGAEEHWAIKEVFNIANTSLFSPKEESSASTSSSSFCRFDQTATTAF